MLLKRVCLFAVSRLYVWLVCFNSVDVAFELWWFVFGLLVNYYMGYGGWFRGLIVVLLCVCLIWFGCNCLVCLSLFCWVAGLGLIVLC